MGGLGGPDLHRLTTDADKALHAREYETAAKLYLRALEHTSLQRPQRAAILSNLGLVWQTLDQIEKAAGAFAGAVQINPKLAPAQIGLANICALQGSYSTALQHYDLALQSDPGSAIAHTNRALCLEGLGRIEEAWAESEWRYAIPAATSLYPYRYTKPRWKGEPLHGSTLLVHREQGLGDIMQYLRFLPLLGRFEGQVVFECPAEILPLVPPQDYLRLLPAETHPVPEEAFDCYVPLLSLPHILGCGIRDLAAMCPYVFAGKSGENRFSRRSPGERFKVGFVWSGSSFETTRNAVLADFLPLLDLKACLISLQRDVDDSEAGRLSGLGIENGGAALRDFGDTRDALHAIDVVVTVDTAVAHLAGAMAKPTWLLLNTPAAVRWMVGRTDTPWYPTMRIRRKSDGQTWQDMIAAVAREIASHFQD